MKYIKKPVEVDAFQYMDANNGAWPDWALQALSEGHISHSGLALSIYTNEGTLRCNPGDWLIHAADGRIWPTDDAYFKANYEEATLGRAGAIER